MFQIRSGRRNLCDEVDLVFADVPASLLTVDIRAHRQPRHNNKAPRRAGLCKM
jgi:hypothetical protein